VTNKCGGLQRAIKETDELRTANRDAGIFSHHEERQKGGATRKELRKGDIARLLGEQFITACEKPGLNEAFATFAGRMKTVSGMLSAADAMDDLDDNNEAQNVAYEEAEEEHLRSEAFEEFSDEKRR
jgi:hypothetical protein